MIEEIEDSNTHALYIYERDADVAVRYVVSIPRLLDPSSSTNYTTTA
jgi:hypothetical protein